jgi:hypothetical protein
MRSLLNSAQRNGERAENNGERQRPKAELDFQCGAGGTADDEPDYAGERHPCPASGFGELVGVSPATNERRKVDSQLRDVRRHYGGRRRAFQSKLPQHILGRHGGDAEHACEDRDGTVGIGEAAKPHTDPEKPSEERSLKPQQLAQWRRSGPCDRAGRQRHQAHHRHKDRNRQQRPDLTETTGHIMRSHDYHVPGDMGGEKSAKGEKADDIDCAGGSTQHGR